MAQLPERIELAEKRGQIGTHHAKNLQNQPLFDHIGGFDILGFRFCFIIELSSPFLKTGELHLGVLGSYMNVLSSRSDRRSHDAGYRA